MLLTDGTNARERFGVEMRVCDVVESGDGLTLPTSTLADSSNFNFGCVVLDDVRRI